MPKFIIDREDHADINIDKSLTAALSQARRLSKVAPGAIWSDSLRPVYLILLDAEGTPQGQWTFIGGQLADKDLVEDWDK